MADFVFTRWNVTYESMTSSVNTKSSRSFSITIRGIERALIRTPSGRELLCRQSNLEETETTELVSDIPSMFLAGEETCSQYVAGVLSTTVMESSIQHHIASNISRDAIDKSRVLEEKEEGFLIEAEVEVVKETSFNGFVSSADYDLEGRRKPIEQDCIICLEKMSKCKGQIMRLMCCHHFHRDCILSWLRRKHTCPTCRDNIHNPRPQLKPGEVKCFNIKGAIVTSKG